MQTSSQRLTLAPTVPDDLPAVIGEPIPYRIKALTAKVGETVLAIGGFAYPPGGAVIAFIQFAPDAKRYPVAMMKAAKRMMEIAKRDGLRKVVAAAQCNVEGSDRFLARLGFVKTELSCEGGDIYVWMV